MLTLWKEYSNEEIENTLEIIKALIKLRSIKYKCPLTKGLNLDLSFMIETQTSKGKIYIINDDLIIYKLKKIRNNSMYILQLKDKTFNLFHTITLYIGKKHFASYYIIKCKSTDVFHEVYDFYSNKSFLVIEPFVKKSLTDNDRVRMKEFYKLISNALKMPINIFNFKPEIRNLIVKLFDIKVISTV